MCAVDLGHDVVGEADDGQRAVEMIGRTRPQLVLLDLQLPTLDGFGVVAAIRLIAPEVKILILSSHCDRYTVFRADAANVQGFVDKNTNSVTAVKDALEAIQEGTKWFSPAFLRVRATHRQDPNAFDKILTDRECAVLALAGVPLSDREIAGELGISPETAEKHRSNILRKLDLQTGVELVRYARTNGFTLAARRNDDGPLIP